VTDERVLGEDLAISVASAEPFLKVINGDDDLKGLDETWFNLKTHVRNYLGAYGDKVPKKPSTLVAGCVEEIEVIEGLLADSMPLVVYNTDHNSLCKVFQHARLKSPRTPKQLEYAKYENALVNGVLASYPVRPYKQKLIGGGKAACIITHHPANLLSQYTFKELVLLESHTGNVKRRLAWNSKLVLPGDAPRIPFNTLTLQVMGDDSQFFSMKQSVKRALLDLATSNKWTPMTSEAKILANLKHLDDKEQVNLFRTLLRSTIR